MMAIATGAAMWVVDAIRDPGTETFAGREEHRPKRLDQRLLDAISDVAWGVEAGEAGLKSAASPDLVSEGCARAADHGWEQDRGGRTRRESQDGIDRQIGRIHNGRGGAFTRDVQDEWDGYLNELGSLLFQGYGCKEALQHLRAAGWDAALGSVHMLALERWVSKVGLRCDPDQTPAKWRGSRVHEDRRHAARAFADLRRTPEGTTHAAVLHVVYGPPDPFVLTLGGDAMRTLGKDLAPIARYTETVEAQRQKLVREEARQRSETGPRVFARETQEATRLAVVNGMKISDATANEEGIARVYDLDRHRTAQIWANRVISSGDAIRAALQPFTEPLPEQGPGESRLEVERRREARSERKRLHNAANDAFLLAVKIEANRMLTDASRAFEASWQRS